MTGHTDMPRAAEVRPAESLGELAKMANTAAEKGAEELRVAGEALVKAKKLCKQGEWLPWLKKNIKFSPRHAQRLMRIVERRPPRGDAGSHLDALSDPLPWSDEDGPDASNATSGRIWSGNNSDTTPVQSQTSAPKPPSPPPPPAPSRPWTLPDSGSGGRGGGRGFKSQVEYEDGVRVEVETPEEAELKRELGIVPTEEEMRAAIETLKYGVPLTVKKAILVAKALKQLDDLNFTLISLGKVVPRAPGLSDTKPVVDRLGELLLEFEPTGRERTLRLAAEVLGIEKEPDHA